jgi:DNA-binding CsgD family transcriptional regulator
MTRLFPHLKRAVLAELRLADVHALATAAGMERGQGMAVLDGQRRLHFVNPTLARFLASRDGLAFGAGGLRVVDPAAQRALDAAMREALDTADGRMADGRAWSLSDKGGVHVERPSGLAPWLVQAVPLPASRDGPFAGMAGVVLVVTDTEARAAAAQGRLRDAWGLSPAEAALAAALAGGTTLADHARKRGVSLETVRSQMASIRRKTGCQRQAELVALVGAVMRQIAIA